MSTPHHLLRDLLAIFFLISLSLPFSTLAQAAADSAHDARYEHGAKLYKRYCVKCHGEKADGEGRMTIKLYRKKHTQLPANFTLGIFINRPDPYLRKIITEGGEKHKLSHYMPPFNGEISAQGIEDLIHFIKKTAVHAQIDIRKQ